MIDEYSINDISDIGNTPVKGMTRAVRCKKDTSKARRKRWISKHVYGIDWYDNLHQYSKNKVHCSYNLCRFRPVWDPNAKPIQDIRTEAKMRYREDEWLKI